MSIWGLNDASLRSALDRLVGADLLAHSKPQPGRSVWGAQTKVIEVVGDQLVAQENFIFKRHFPIHKLFERSCELGLWRLGADKIAAIFGMRLNRRMRGKLATVIDQIEHGHHVFRALPER